MYIFQKPGVDACPLHLQAAPTSTHSFVVIFFLILLIQEEQVVSYWRRNCITIICCHTQKALAVAFCAPCLHIMAHESVLYTVLFTHKVSFFKKLEPSCGNFIII